MSARNRFAFVGALGIFLLLGVGTAQADGNVQLFAGGQLDFSNYVFVGAQVPLPGNNGNGFAVRGLVDTGGYDYVSGDLGTVKANFGGGELDLVYQVSHKDFWSDFIVGVNDTYTGLTPYDPSNRLRGDQIEPRIGLDGGATQSPWREDWYGYYGTRLQDYEAQVDGTHALSPLWRLGLQGYTEGNPSYSLYEIGPYAGVTLAKDSELQFSAGPAWESGFTPRVYFRALYFTRI